MVMEHYIIIPVYNNLLDNPYYQKCINTWQFYCNQHDIKLCFLEGEKNNHADMCYDRWLDFSLSKEGDRITFVDADTFIRWDAPNFAQLFTQNSIGIAVVPDQGGKFIGSYHFNQWVGFKPNLKNFVTEYFNCGFVSLKHKHLQVIQQEILKYKSYYLDNKSSTKSHPFGLGKEDGIPLDALDQTPINLILQENCSKDISFLTKEFNCQVPYLYGGNEPFLQHYHDFSFLNEGIIFHIGGTNVTHPTFLLDFESNFKSYYK